MPRRRPLTGPAAAAAVGRPPELLELIERAPRRDASQQALALGGRAYAEPPNAFRSAGSAAISPPQMIGCLAPCNEVVKARLCAGGPRIAWPSVDSGDIILALVVVRP